MEIKKVLNNNVVVAEDEGAKEIVVMGRGLAFQKKVGDDVDETKIEKTFVMESHELSEKLSELLSEISAKHLRVADDIVQYAKEKLNAELSDNIYLTLTDHINFALSRYKQGINLKNALLWEIKRFYQPEYQVGLKALGIIQEEFGYLLDEDEAGFIALHIVNARQDGQQMTTTVTMTQIVQDILNIVTYHYGMVLDETSLNYTRFVTHLQYFAQRMLMEEVVDSGDDFLYEQVQIKYPDAFKCTQKIDAYLKNTHFASLTRDEQVYLTIHIYRVTERNSLS
ncbi:BglG family transcription antiterminator LicT [Listeria fleischmannii]|jgi:beta-glucoside operon transcriptional antiterminator|uniref:Transcription antiterminator LicT n=2 Tax=Listeria fleischmannii TaxID=1069827 RepID=W7DEG9_9LIST|nr:PRD domain-containing protein [Listeria fleischmannii]EIA20607.1 transcription antiterminator LicT [Listeria fleischmannii subsp. coloradonensis]EUJ47546.1 transcription antiterminator LicT [Listeria fleischmannii FSL S10-1203]MBC1398699.1 PRD domain-containing protein [Listeria fleischmannii]MBC1418184.1 PRD domain-containing protein [Listeria fleischmannii]MBC1426957.1 PRD domain-containing protein [Listeria fleischmannii]